MVLLVFFNSPEPLGSLVSLYEGYSRSSWNLVVKCSNIFIILSFFEISEVDIYELASLANNKIFFTRTKIKVTLATQVDEVAASQKND